VGFKVKKSNSLKYNSLHSIKLNFIFLLPSIEQTPRDHFTKILGEIAKIEQGLRTSFSRYALPSGDAHFLQALCASFKRYPLPSGATHLP